jgi:uncharacterized protein (DUF983 family)
MSKKLKSIGSFLFCKCPRCHEGHIFKHGIFHSKFTKVKQNCPSCGVKYETEPGFFWGAMYFSYALIVGLCLISGFTLYSFYQSPPLLLSASIVVGLVVLLMPLIVRYSRMLMIYLIAPYRQYDPKAIEQFKAQSK